MACHPSGPHRVWTGMADLNQLSKNLTIAWSTAIGSLMSSCVTGSRSHFRLSCSLTFWKILLRTKRFPFPLGRLKLSSRFATASLMPAWEVALICLALCSSFLQS